jgi:enamine deaminase RidA (YjgF/YER057c/UK114 family)
MKRQLVPAVSRQVDLYGYSRAVKVGRHVFVAGTAPVMEADADPPSDAYGQARRCLEIVLAALEELGARAEDVVRTRVFLTSADDADAVGRAHAEVFRAIRPATAAVVVASLLDPRWLVEIEADAIVAD